MIGYDMGNKRQGECCTRHCRAVSATDAIAGLASSVLIYLLDCLASSEMDPQTTTLRCAKTATTTPHVSSEALLTESIAERFCECGEFMTSWSVVLTYDEVFSRLCGIHISIFFHSTIQSKCNQTDSLAAFVTR